MWNEELPLAILADDLTGACDTACQFCRYGLQTVVTHFSRLNWDGSVRVLAVNTDSRKQGTTKAHQSIYTVSKQVIETGRIPFYKKIDSTLKGNWCSELSALVKVCLPDIILIAPALPIWGRTTENGIQQLNGHPVSELRTHLEGKSDSGNCANLVEVLQQHLGWRVKLIKRAAYRKGPEWIEQQILSHRSKGCQFLVLDATNDEDLKNICLGGCRLDQKVLWVGSAGLARFLPLGWGYQPTKPVPSEEAFCREIWPEKPVLLVIGSLNSSNLAQLEHLGTRRSLFILNLEAEDAEAGPVMQAKLSRAQQSLQRGLDVALNICPRKPFHSRGHLQGLHDTLQFLSAKLIDSKQIGGLIIVGGDTAMKVYEKTGASGIRMIGEVQPGIPYGQWIGGLLDNQPVVTKAGGFGQADTLTRATEFLRRFSNEFPRPEERL